MEGGRGNAEVGKIRDRESTECRIRNKNGVGKYGRFTNKNILN